MHVVLRHLKEGSDAVEACRGGMMRERRSCGRDEQDGREEGLLKTGHKLHSFTRCSRFHLGWIHPYTGDRTGNLESLNRSYTVVPQSADPKNASTPSNSHIPNPYPALTHTRP